MKNFKKPFKGVLLALSLVFALTACNNASNNATTTSESPATTSTAPATTSTAPATTSTAPATTSTAPVTAAKLAYADVDWEDTSYINMTQEELLNRFEDRTPKGTVTYGTSTVMDANLYWGWTNISPNSLAKSLMTYDYSLVYTTPGEEFFINNVVVENWDVTENADGTATYRFKIHENLKYSDGTPITGKDYLFTTMLHGSPEFAANDGSATGGFKLVGYEAFNTGETKTFEGMRLLGEYEFSFTIKAEELPYFYALGFFYGSYPDPMHVMAPGVTLTDDGNGATLSEEFTADLLRETISDPTTGYRYQPKVTSGAYMLESFDNTTFTCVLVANPYFLCMPDGMKPGVEKIVIKNTTQSTQMNEIEIGQVDILSGLTTGTQIDQGIEMVDNGILGGYDSYPRNGYGLIAMHCDFGPTQFVAVRQALCYLLDRDEFGRQYSGGYAIVVDARYAEPQWTYQAMKDRFDDDLIKYTLNTNKANEILDEDGWVLNETGGAYVPGDGKVRHKMVDGELMSLTIEWCSSKDNAVSDLLSVMLPPAAEQVGMKINQTIQDSVLESYYRTNVDVPFFHMFNMGTNFGTPDSPWNSYRTEPQFWGSPYNQNFIANEILERETKAMMTSDPSDREGFLEHYYNYIVEWNRVLPDIPLYANIYHDFYTTRVEGYMCTPYWGASRNLPRLTVTN